MMRDEITRLAMRDAENETSDNLRSAAGILDRLMAGHAPAVGQDHRPRRCGDNPTLSRRMRQQPGLTPRTRAWPRTWPTPARSYRRS